MKRVTSNADQKDRQHDQVRDSMSRHLYSLLRQQENSEEAILGRSGLLVGPVGRPCSSWVHVMMLNNIIILLPERGSTDRRRREGFFP